MTSLIFPDINFWVALSLRAHLHHQSAWRWYQGLREDEELVFCRMTQLSLLRLLTMESVARHETLSQIEAWAVYDGWLQRGGACYVEEPMGLEQEFRWYANRTTSSPKEWADSYLAAFAAAASIPLVTFDHALSLRYSRSILLRT